MMTQTPEVQISAQPACLYMSLELASKNWKLAFSDGSCARPRRRVVTAGAAKDVAAEIALAKQKLGLTADAPVRSVYEAGRDGFWVHRMLTELGCDNVVIDPSSLQVDRRARRAKTDRIDLESLLANLIRHCRGEKKVWRLVRIPTEHEEDARRPHRERERLKKEMTALASRIRGLLATQGVKIEGYVRLRGRLDSIRRWDGQPLPSKLRMEIERMCERWEFAREQLRKIETAIDAEIEAQQTRASQQATTLQLLRAVSARSGMVLSTELFAWRQIKNRRELGALAGMVGTPFNSGDADHDQGISKAGNHFVRNLMVELAWNWLRFQPSSALSRWFRERFGKGGKRMRRIGIVGLARKLLIAFWRFVEHGVVPAGAVLRRAAA
jgi:transposase